MKYIQINSIFSSISRQKNIRHLSWMKRFQERLLQIANAPARLASVINTFQRAVGSEDEAYLVITKSDLTAPIEEADKARDNTYSGMTSMLDFMKRLGTADQQQAAERVIERVNYHNVKISDRYEDENEKMAQLVQDLKGGTLAADIATLNLTATVALLEQQNQQVISLMKQRQSDRSTQESNVMGKARAVTDAAYEDAVTVLNAFAVTEFNGQSSPYDEIIRIINSDIDYYSKYVFASNNSGGTTNNGGGSNANANDNTNPSTDSGQGENGGGGENTGGGGSNANANDNTNPSTDSGQGDNTGGDNGGGTGTITPGGGGSNPGGLGEN